MSRLNLVFGAPLIAILTTVLAVTEQEAKPADIAKQNENAIIICIHEGNAPKFCRDKLKRSEILSGYVSAE